MKAAGEENRTQRAHAAGWTTLALLISAASGFAVTLIAARVLGSSAYLDFATAWASLYMLVAALNGIQQESSRVSAQDAVLSGREPSAVGSLTRGTLGVVLVWGIATGAVLCAVSLAGSGLAILWLLLPALPFVAGQMLVCGVLAGGGRLKEFATVLIVEAMTRLVLFAGALIWADRISVSVLFFFAVLPFAAWLLLLPKLGVFRRPNVNSAASTSHSGWKPQAARFLTVGLATLLTGLLTTGIPVVISISNRAESAAAVGTLVLLVTLTRAPLMVPLAAFQSAIVGFFVRNRDRALSWFCAGSSAAVVLGGVIAAVAALLGPLLLQLLFGETYEATSQAFFWVTLSAVGLAVQTLAGCAVLAAGSQVGYLSSWAVAAVATIGIFLTGLPLELRTIVALGIGPLAGACVGALWAGRALTTSRTLSAKALSSPEG